MFPKKIHDHPTSSWILSRKKNHINYSSWILSRKNNINDYPKSIYAYYLPIVIPPFFFWFRTTGVSGRFYIELFEPQVHKGKDSHPGGVLRERLVGAEQHGKNGGFSMDII